MRKSCNTSGARRENGRLNQRESTSGIRRGSGRLNQKEILLQLTRSCYQSSLTTVRESKRWPRSSKRVIWRKNRCVEAERQVESQDRTVSPAMTWMTMAYQEPHCPLCNKVKTFTQAKSWTRASM